MYNAQAQTMEIFEKVGAVITGSHFVYTSGKHGSAYVNKDAVYPFTWEVEKLCYMLAHQFYNIEGPTIEAVAAPALGGIILSQWTAYALYRLSTGLVSVRALYAEKADDDFTFKRGQDKLLVGKRVLVVEDVLTTGGSVVKVLDAIRVLNAEIVGVGALCNRGGITAEQLGVKQLISLTKIPLEAFDAESCPLCAAGVPINTTVGKGQAFLNAQI